MSEKSNSIKDWFNKTIKDINDSIQESEIENSYDANHDQFEIFQYETSILESPKVVYGSFDSSRSVLTYYWNVEYSLYSIVINEKTNETFYIVKYLDDTSVETTYKETKYIRPAKVVLLSKEVREVKVIKAKNKYYIYEKPEN